MTSDDDLRAEVRDRVADRDRRRVHRGGPLDGPECRIVAHELLLVPGYSIVPYRR